MLANISGCSSLPGNPLAGDPLDPLDLLCKVRQLAALASLSPVFFKLVTLDKAIDTTLGVDYLLLTRVKGMAVAADFYPNLIFR